MNPSSLSKTTKNNYVGDTTLRLDGLCYGAHVTTTQSRNKQTDITSQDDSCKLVLGLGPTPSSYSDELDKGVAAPVYGRGISIQRCDSMLQLGLSGGNDVISNGLEYSSSLQSQSFSRRAVDIDDEGSTSLKKFGGCMTKLIFPPIIGSSVVSAQTTNNSAFQQLDDAKSGYEASHLTPEPSAISTAFSISELGSATSSDCRRLNTRKCRHPDCTHGARGSTGLCIRHGGGQRCQKPGCDKGSESRTPYCKAHGGGRRCQQLGCTKSAEGKTDHCIAHGGGRRCEFPGGCTKAARGKTGLCIRHGGGKRCEFEGCKKSAEGKIGCCISHGGGKRCQYTGCTKGAQGATKFCKAHGGGKRCTYTGCNKGAEGSTSLCKGHGGGKRCRFDGGGICPKSVHGGTNFCVAHGGGKRCVEPGCTKSARGKTSCCVKHGGGKRCKTLGCTRSAQGSTDFCKAHGGGKRCVWAEGKCEKFARGRDGHCAAHGNLVRGSAANGKGAIGPGLFRGLVPQCSKASFDTNTGSSSGLSMLSDSYDSYEQRPSKRQQLIPPQVLVPLSMKLSDFFTSRSEKAVGDMGKGVDVTQLSGPEGRVHGGGLFFASCDLNNSVDGL